MTSSQKFCTECGALLVPDNRFCGKCGRPVAGQNPAGPPDAPRTAAPQQAPVPQGTPLHAGPEQITGIVPFIEQGLLSVIHYILLVTPQRLIFCTWNPDTDEAMSDADDVVMQESCNIAETTDEIAYFRAKDWTIGPWQRYLSMPIDTIAASAPGSISLPLAGITGINIVCENRTSTQDQIYIDVGDRRLTFDLMYSQGPFVFSLLQPILGEKVSISDHLHKRHGLDRLLTGQEYK
ncbi:MAG: zinc ribbon domain-containing protein [Methanoregula sp.]|nr:zinc ribbon domain-containing protein [Methanoregula sp.]